MSTAKYHQPAQDMPVAIGSTTYFPLSRWVWIQPEQALHHVGCVNEECMEG
jgi:hypothetical protein